MVCAELWAAVLAAYTSGPVQANAMSRFRPRTLPRPAARTPRRASVPVGGSSRNVSRDFIHYPAKSLCPQRTKPWSFTTRRLLMTASSTMAFNFEHRAQSLRGHAALGNDCCVLRVEAICPEGKQSVGP